MPEPSAVESTSSKRPELPGAVDQALGVPVPTKNGCTHRRSSSSSPAAMQLVGHRAEAVLHDVGARLLLELADGPDRVAAR